MPTSMNIILFRMKGMGMRLLYLLYNNADVKFWVRAERISTWSPVYMVDRHGQQNNFAVLVLIAGAMKHFLPFQHFDVAFQLPQINA